MRWLRSTGLVLALGCAQGWAQGPTPEACAEVRSAVLPSPDELGWREIPWRETMVQGILDAQTERKPVVLWAMNGHPLGGT